MKFLKNKITCFIFLLLSFFAFISLSSCNAISSTNVYNISSLKVGDSITSGKKFNLKKLIYGTKTVSSGNYCILFGSLGSNNAPSADKSQTDTSLFYPSIVNSPIINFLDYDNNSSGNITKTKDIKINNDEAGQYSNLGFYNLWNNEVTKLDDQNNNLKIVCFSYIFGYSQISYGYHTTFGGSDVNAKKVYINPFYKWTDTDQNNVLFNPTRKKPKKNGDKAERWAYHHKTGKYADNTKYGKNIRSLFTRLSQLLPALSFSGENLTTQGGKMCIYYKGICRTFQDSININSTDIGIGWYDTKKPS